MTALVRGLGLEFHLPLLDLALVTLKAAPGDRKNELLGALEAVIGADRRVSLHEFMVLTLVRSQLAPRPRPARAREISSACSIRSHARTSGWGAGGRMLSTRCWCRCGGSSMRRGGFV